MSPPAGWRGSFTVRGSVNTCRRDKIIGFLRRPSRWRVNVSLLATKTLLHFTSKMISVIDRSIPARRRASGVPLPFPPLSRRLAAVAYRIMTSEARSRAKPPPAVEMGPLFFSSRATEDSKLVGSISSCGSRSNENPASTALLSKTAESLIFFNENVAMPVILEL